MCDTICLWFSRSLVLACLLVAVLGCEKPADNLVPVKGKLLVAGADYDPATQEEVMIIFYPAGNPEGTSYPAVIQNDGTFTVPGVEGNGVPAGKYHISLERISDDRKTKVSVPRKLAGRESELEKEITSTTGDVGSIDVTVIPAS